MRRVLHRVWIIRRSWPVLAICAFYIYLAFHALSGSQGLMSWVDYEDDIRTMQTKLLELEQQKSDLEFQIEALRADNLNRDLLDIYAREYVFLSRANQLTIWLDH